MILSEFVGSAWARFERSTLPDHKGTRTVVLRFLKIITPVNCLIPLYNGNIVQPEEGELHRKRRPHKTDHQLWSVNIDEKTKRRNIIQGLRSLWDA